MKLSPFLDEVKDLAAQGKTKTQVAAHYGVSEAAVRRFAAKHAIEFGQATTDHVVSDDPAEWGDIQALLASRGLKLADWVVTGGRVNEWADQRQLRVDIKPRADLLVPARTDGWRPPPRVPLDPTKPQLAVCVPDIHVPHHDVPAHHALCEWLRTFRPERGVIMGDLLDYDAVSRHRKSPKWSRPLKETIQAAYEVLRDYVDASPGTVWEMVDGNHEDRMRNAILDSLPAVHGLTRAEIDGQPEPVVHSPYYLLRMDELGITPVDTGGDEYTHAQIKLAPDIAARHGDKARKGAGASALETLKQTRYSVLMGHTHRQGFVWYTTHDIDGKPVVVCAAECGTLAQIPGGLGYAREPDWQQGWATVLLRPGQHSHVELASVIDGVASWRDWRSA